MQLCALNTHSRPIQIGFTTPKLQTTVVRFLPSLLPDNVMNARTSKCTTVKLRKQIDRFENKYIFERERHVQNDNRGFAGRLFKKPHSRMAARESKTVLCLKDISKRLANGNVLAKPGFLHGRKKSGFWWEIRCPAGSPLFKHRHSGIHPRGFHPVRAS